MNYQTFTCSNGLRVIHLASPSAVIYCGLAVKAGTRHERPGEEGIAHFCEHLSFKGTHRRTAVQIINALEGVGGELNAFTNKEDTVYYAATTRQHFAQTVDVLCDIVFSSEYPQHEVEKECEVVCDEIESYEDSPAELIFDEFENLLFKGHALGHNILGTAEQVKRYTSADAHRFADRYYRPDNCIFFASGDIDFKHLLKMLERMSPGNPEKLEKPEPPENPENPGKPENPESPESPENPELPELPAPPENPAPLEAPPFLAPSSSSPLLSEFSSEIIRHRNTHQSHVMIGALAYAADDPDRWPLFLLNNILGGPAMNSRLNLSLRERNGLVYTVESSMVSYSDTGAWSVYFGCDPHDVRHCCRLVRRELDKLMSTPLTEPQLRKAKQQIRGQLAIAADNREQFALDFAKNFLHRGTERNLDDILAHVEALTAQDLQRVARAIFAPERLLTLIYM